MNVALVIPTCNRQDLLKRAIASALAQDTPYSRIIIVNDFPQPISISIPGPITVLQTIGYEGLAATRQFALDNIPSDIHAISYLDDDDELLPFHNSTLTKAIEDGTHFAFTKATFKYPDFETTDPEPNNKGPKRYYDPSALLDQNIAPVSSFIHTVEASNKIGGWDKSILRLEDWDFWARLYIEFGAPKFIDQITNVIYRGHNSLTTGDFNYSLSCSWRDIVKDRIKSLAAESRGTISASDRFRFHIPKVGVIMPFFNAEKYIEQAIASITSQTFTDFELIGINDRSTDRSRQIFIDYMQKDHRLRLFDNPWYSGVSHALNFGLLVSRSEYIARMDADDVSDSNRFKLQVEFLNKHRDVFVVGTNFWSMNSDLSKIEWENYLPTDPAEIEAKLLDSCCIGHPTIMMRRRVVEIMGGYDASPDTESVEDYDLWLRVSKRFKIANIPEFLLKYRQHDGQVNAIKRIIQERNFLGIRAKYRKMAGLPERIDAK